MHEVRQAAHQVGVRQAQQVLGLVGRPTAPRRPPARTWARTAPVRLGPVGVDEVEHDRGVGPRRGSSGWPCATIVRTRPSTSQRCDGVTASPLTANDASCGRTGAASVASSSTVCIGIPSDGARRPRSRHDPAGRPPPLDLGRRVHQFDRRPPRNTNTLVADATPGPMVPTYAPPRPPPRHRPRAAPGPHPRTAPMTDSTPQPDDAPTAERHGDRPGRPRARRGAGRGARRRRARGGDGEAITQPVEAHPHRLDGEVLLEEVRHASLDDAGRRRLREIHERSLAELSEVLSDDLQEELERGHAAVRRRTRRASRSCASPRPSSWAGSRASSTASRPRW